MKCGSCNVCRRKLFVNSAAFEGGKLVLTLPEAAPYTKGSRYCLVITTALPADVTRDAPVVAVIGGGTTQYPLTTRCCTPVLEQQISPRKRYPVRVNTTAAGGSLTILCALPETDDTTLAALNITTPAAPAAAEKGAE